MNITKRFSLAVIVAVLVALSTNAQTKTDRDKEPLKGKVKTIRTETFYASKRGENIVESSRKDFNETIYNENGNIIERRTYKFDGTLRSRYVFVYDDKGEKIEETYYDGKDSILYKSKSKYRFEFPNKIVESEIYDAKSMTNRTSKAIYNSDEQLLEAYHFNEDGSLSTKTIQTYDNKGRLLSMEATRADGTPISTIKSNPETKTSETIGYGAPSQEPTVFKIAPCKEDQFDALGNWTRKICDRITVRNGKEEKTVEVMKRTITYY